MNISELINKIPALTIIFFIGFILVSIAHIISHVIKCRPFQIISKPLCLLFLGLSVLFAFPNHPFLYVAFFSSMIGDAFLLYHHKTFSFCAGAFFFLLTHICFYIEIHFVLLNKIFPWYFHLLFASIILGITVALYPFTKKFKQSLPMTLGGNFYYSVIASSIITFALAFAISIDKYNPTFMWLAIIGIASFLTSDTYLIYEKFVHNNDKKRDLIIMPTYLVGQMFIYLGFVLTYLTII